MIMHGKQGGYIVFFPLLLVAALLILFITFGSKGVKNANNQLDTSVLGETEVASENPVNTR